MSVVEYTKIKIKNALLGRTHAIGRRVAQLTIPVFVVGVTASGYGSDMQTVRGRTARRPARTRERRDAQGLQ